MVDLARIGGISENRIGGISENTRMGLFCLMTDILSCSSKGIGV